MTSVCSWYDILRTTWKPYNRASWPHMSSSHNNLLRPSDAYMRQYIITQSLVRIMACRLFGPSPYLIQGWFIVNGTVGNEIHWNLDRIIQYSLKKMYLKMSSVKCRAVCLGLSMLGRVYSLNPLGMALGPLMYMAGDLSSEAPIFWRYEHVGHVVGRCTFKFIAIAESLYLRKFLRKERHTHMKWKIFISYMRIGGYN